MKPSNPQSPKLLLGKFGEDLASNYLSSHGYSIVARNFRARWGELDIVAIYQNILVVVEVKTRSGKQFGSPFESITPRKLKELVTTMEYYLLLHPQSPRQQRIDGIGIELDEEKHVVKFEHVQNVTI